MSVHDIKTETALEAGITGDWVCQDLANMTGDMAGGTAAGVKA